MGSVALNIADLAEHTIDAVPDRVALICGDEQITYAELEERANRFALRSGGRGKAAPPMSSRFRAAKTGTH